MNREQIPKVLDIPTLLERDAQEKSQEDLRKWQTIWESKLEQERFSPEYRGLIGLGKNPGQTLEPETSISCDTNNGIYDILFEGGMVIGRFLPASSESESIQPRIPSITSQQMRCWNKLKSSDPKHLKPDHLLPELNKIINLGSDVLTLQDITLSDEVLMRLSEAGYDVRAIYFTPNFGSITATKKGLVDSTSQLKIVVDVSGQSPTWIYKPDSQKQIDKTPPWVYTNQILEIKIGDQILKLAHVYISPFSNSELRFRTITTLVDELKESPIIAVGNFSTKGANMSYGNIPMNTLKELKRIPGFPIGGYEIAAGLANINPSLTIANTNLKLPNIPKTLSETEHQLWMDWLNEQGFSTGDGKIHSLGNKRIILDGFFSNLLPEFSLDSQDNPPETKLDHSRLNISLKSQTNDLGIRDYQPPTTNVLSEFKNYRKEYFYYYLAVVGLVPVALCVLAQAPKLFK